jgi:hypothetical protein
MACEPIAVGASTDGAGALLAEMARLEAASVPAFRRFARELASFGAPRALVRSAERAARDEVRHARVMGRLAKRRGAAPGRFEVPRAKARSLEAFAIENAVEGCVRECFGALVAAHQAESAQDADVRRAMAGIAEDEARHAALAWEVSRWLTPRLSVGARRRVAEAMRGALAALKCEARSTNLGATAPALGLPDGSRARALADAFAASLVPA